VRRSKITAVLFPLGIFLFGFGISLWFGGQGLNALDSPIVFDGAWRRLSGQAFFLDFATPNGYVPITLQVLFFKVFGVNWLAYCLHAAVLNGLFALLVHGILRLVGGPRWLAAGYACLSAVVFYPPMGVPYMEQHAFFFILLAVWMVLKGAALDEKASFWMWVLLPTVWLLAILSKQIPGFFAVPVSVLALVAWLPVRAWKRLVAPLLLGVVPVGLGFWVIVGWPGEIWPQFWENFWTRPQALGNERLEVWRHGFFKSVRTFMWYPFQALSSYNFLHRHLIYLPFLIFPLEWAFRKWKKLPRPAWSQLRLPALAMGMVVACSLFMHLTFNQVENGLPLALVAMGMVHVHYREWLKGLFATPPKRFQPILAGAGLLLWGYSALGTLDFHLQVNVPRRVLDFDVGPHYKKDMPHPEKIGWLDYQAVYHYTLLRPTAFISWMQKQEGNFLLFGDLSIVYGLSGKPSIAPFLWFHEGLTFPYIESPAFAAVDQALERATREKDVRFVVFEQIRLNTWKDIRLEDFPRTCESLTSRQFRTLQVGGFWIWELR
jgi:hypothetical protein